MLYLLNHICYFNKNLQDMWTDSSYVNCVNLVKTCYNSRDIEPFQENTLLARPVYLYYRHRICTFYI